MPQLNQNEAQHDDRNSNYQNAGNSSKKVSTTRKGQLEIWSHQQVYESKVVQAIKFKNAYA
jgi:hypothetical protein